MERLIALVCVLFLCCPALASELMTKHKTPVYETPSKAAKVVGELPGNVKVQSDQRKDFWFHIAAEINGGMVSGWVNQADVTNMMGRSKGQLLAENKRLYEELVTLRKQTKTLRRQLTQTSEALKKAEEEKGNLKAELAASNKKLKAALAEIRRLGQALEKARPGGK